MSWWLEFGTSGESTIHFHKREKRRKKWKIESPTPFSLLVHFLLFYHQSLQINISFYLISLVFYALSCIFLHIHVYSIIHNFLMFFWPVDTFNALKPLDVWILLCGDINYFSKRRHVCYLSVLLLYWGRKLTNNFSCSVFGACPLSYIYLEINTLTLTVSHKTIIQEDALHVGVSLPENLLQLPPVDMQANPILLLFYFQVNSKKLFLHSHCAQCTVTVHWSCFEVLFE
jgi:hypothetical protein